MTAPSTAARSAPMVRVARRPRIEGVDAARTLAIVGMLVAHLSGVASDRWTFLHWTNGFSAGGFAVLAGVSMGLTRRLAVPGWRVWPPEVVRSGLLFALGVWLAEISFGPVVILCVYAVLFLIALPYRRLTGPALLAVALVLTLVTPVLSLWVRRATWFDRVERGNDVTWDMLRGADPVLTVARTLVLDGVYPLLTWLPLALAGWGAHRSGLLDPSRWRHLAAVTALLVVAGFGGSAVVEAVTASRAELLETEAAQVLDDLNVDPADGPFLIEVEAGTVEVDPADAEEVGRWFAQPVDNGFGVSRFTEWKVLLTAGHHTGTTFELWQILALTSAFLLVFALVARVAPVVVQILGWPGRIPLTVYSAHLVVGWQQQERELWLDQDATGQARVLVAYVAGAFVLGALFRNRRGPLEWILHQATTWTSRLVAARSERSADPAESGSGGSPECGPRV